MVVILQRLSEWNTQMLDRTPIEALKAIVRDAEDLLEEFELPRYREKGADSKDQDPTVEPKLQDSSEPAA